MSSPLSKQRLNSLPCFLGRVSSAQQPSDMRLEIASTKKSNLKRKHSPTCSVLEERSIPLMKLDPRYDLKSEESQSVEGKNKHPVPLREKRFVKRAKLSNNPRTHTKEVPKKCRRCSQTFIQKCQLDMHRKSHFGDRLFTCNLCAKEFSYKYALKHHFRKQHTGERPFKCDRCSKMFFIKASLVRHLRTHTGERPLTCWYCNKLFTHRDLVIEHERTHTDEKPFVCDQCGKKMSYRTAFVRHLRTHIGEKPVEKPYGCMYCEMRFVLRIWLEKHVRIKHMSLRSSNR